MRVCVSVSVCICVACIYNLVPTSVERSGDIWMAAIRKMICLKITLNKNKKIIKEPKMFLFKKNGGHTISAGIVGPDNPTPSP